MSIWRKFDQRFAIKSRSKESDPEIHEAQCNLKGFLYVVLGITVFIDVGMDLAIWLDGGTGGTGGNYKVRAGRALYPYIPYILNAGYFIGTVGTIYQQFVIMKILRKRKENHF